MKQYSVPILLIVFNRLNTTKKVFDAIRYIKPNKLFLAADGYRADKEGEKEKCQEVRDFVLNNIDWPCEVRTLFQDENLGCGYAPATAITWFFKQVEYGIVLEDDCVPSTDFFVFCEQMLEKYNESSEISIISGCNFDMSEKYISLDGSYFFSVFPFTWGWATWRKNWLGYDYRIKDWNTINQRRLLKFIFKQKEYYKVWQNTFNKIYSNVPKDIWDFQFFYLCFKRKQLAIVPSVNLVSNIGHGAGATHTIDSNSILANVKVSKMEFPLQHPLKIERNYVYDKYIQEVNFWKIPKVGLLLKIKRFLKRLFMP